ncbi:MAG: S53 family peptidase [Solirubrobacteraceae bacterium]
MRARIHAALPRFAAIAALAAASAAALSCSAASAAAAAGSAAPLPAGEYAVRSACPAPEVGHASCLAEQLLAATPQARAYNHPIAVARPAGAAQPALSPTAGDFGLRPQDIHSAYALPATGSGEPVIALIDAYNDPTAEADLKRYDEAFGLSACTKANGCFKQVGEHGGESASSLPFPKTVSELQTAETGSEAERELANAAIGWGIEETLDLQAARATCQNCRLLLVEASSTSYTDLEESLRTAETLGAQVISNSWGGPEAGVSGDGPFNDPKTVITASSGDNGYLGWDAEFPSERGFTNYPASSPHVVAVGGTQLKLNGEGKYSSEVVWNGAGASGGGCSTKFAAPEWQSLSPQWPNVGCAGRRSVADVAADADPHSGIAITASSSACETEEPVTKKVVHWCTYGGTSLASPIIAGVFGLAGGSGGIAYPALTLYESRRHAPGTLHDVTEGSNGRCELGFNSKTGLSNCSAAEEAKASCAGHRTCLSGRGYDGPTGVGTPNGIVGFQPGASEPGVPEEPVEAEEKPTERPVEAAVEKPVVVLHPSPIFPVLVAPPSSTVPTGAPPKPLVLGRLSLTNSALFALNRRRPSIARVGFAFELSRPAIVLGRLTRKVRAGKRTRWLPVGRAVTLKAGAGRNSGRLGGRMHLAAGLYRLTLTPSGGPGQSITIHIGG